MVEGSKELDSYCTLHFYTITCFNGRVGAGLQFHLGLHFSFNSVSFDEWHPSYLMQECVHISVPFVEATELNSDPVMACATKVEGATEDHRGS